MEEPQDEEDAELHEKEQEDDGPLTQSSPARRPSHDEEQYHNSLETDGLEKKELILCRRVTTFP